MNMFKNEIMWVTADLARKYAFQRIFGCLPFDNECELEQKAPELYHFVAKELLYPSFEALEWKILKFCKERKMTKRQGYKYFKDRNFMPDMDVQE